jgi:hypothetical protein
MLKHTITTVLISSFALAPLAGCENLPGGKKEQGAVIGGAGGALAGAAIAKGNRGLGALIGGLIGAGGGYLIGANQEKINGQKSEEAREASERAARNPATRDDAFKATTADLNTDGFVTLDEVVAMQKANLSDREMIDRLRRTDQVFELTQQQQNFLIDRGVSRDVVDAMLNMNRTADARQASDRYNDTYNDRPSDRGTYDSSRSDRDRY